MRSLPNKAAIELSVSFIVTFIIAVVIFSLSVYFAVTFFKGAEEIRLSIDAETESKIQDLFSQSGTVVAFPLNKKELHLKESTIYGVGILNLKKKGASDPDFDNNFYVRVQPHTFHDEKGIEPDIGDLSTAEYLDTMKSWIKYFDQSTRIKYNDYASIPILVEAKETMGTGVATKKGTYVFNVCVYAGDPGATTGCSDPRNPQLYGNQIYKMYLTVV